MPQAGNAFVNGMVGPQPETLQILAPLPAKAGPHEVDPIVLVRLPVAARQGVAMRAEGLVDQRRGGRPAGRVERRLVQRREDALERV